MSCLFPTPHRLRLGTPLFVAVLVALAACSEQRKSEIAAPSNLRRNVITQSACATVKDTAECERQAALKALRRAAVTADANASGGLKIAYINDSGDDIGFTTVQNVVNAQELGTIEMLNVQQVIGGALDKGGYNVVFHARDHGGPSTGGTENPFTRVPSALKDALERAMASGVGLITEWQGGSVVWSSLASEDNYFQMTDPAGNLWGWFQGSVDLGYSDWFAATFTRSDDNHPVMAGLDNSFSIPAAEFCYRIQSPDPKLKVLATFVDNTGTVRPAILAGTHSTANVVLWPCDWGDNGAMPTPDANLQKWIANAIRFAAEGNNRGETTKEVPANEPATVTVTDDNGNKVAGIDFPPNTYHEDVTVTVQLVELADGEYCHDYLMGQNRKCLHVDVRNSANQPVINNEKLVVGLCLPAHLPLEFYKFEERNGQPIPLREAAATFLDCENLLVGSVKPRNWMQGLAMGLAKMFTPKLAYASDQGFGGEVDAGHGTSFFTWASPVQVTSAGLALNVFNPGKDAFGVVGVFGLGAKDFAPDLGQAGFSPLLPVNKVTIDYGNYHEEIAAVNFKFAKAINRYAYVKATSMGISYMDINSTTGAFSIVATKPRQGGTLPTSVPFTVRIGSRIRGGLFECGSTGVCHLRH